MGRKPNFILNNLTVSFENDTCKALFFILSQRRSDVLVVYAYIFFFGIHRFASVMHINAFLYNVIVLSLKTTFRSISEIVLMS